MDMGGGQRWTTTYGWMNAVVDTWCLVLILNTHHCQSDKKILHYHLASFPGRFGNEAKYHPVKAD